MYKYYNYVDENGVKCIKCVSTFAKKRVAGIAKCSPYDTFDEDYGRALARFRCDVKVAKKRMKHAEDLFLNACKEVYNAEANWDKYEDYLKDSMTRYKMAEYNLKFHELQNLE